jgi:hypothetical protein
MCSQDPVCVRRYSATAGCPLAAVGMNTTSPASAKARLARNRVTASRPVSSGWSELSAGRGTVSGGGKRWLPVIARSPISAGTFTTNWLDDSVERYDVLVVEDLQIANMLRRANARRRVPAFQPGERG